MSNPHANHQGEPGDTGTGWVLVPREPTPEMLKAGYDAYAAAEWDQGRAKRGPERESLPIAYQALIASAPTPPDRVGEEVGRECCIPDEGEPSFVLLGRDPQAPYLVERWAYDREHAEPDSPKPAMARQIAAEMRAYKLVNPERGLQIASAPSPDPAGAGGDLGELERLSAAASPGRWELSGCARLDSYAWHIFADSRHWTVLAANTMHGCTTPGMDISEDEARSNAAYVVALVNAHRFGKLVASTGSGKEETKGACLTAPDHSAEPEPEDGLGPTGECSSRGPADLVSYLHRQWGWSKETFGPALRTKGIVQHITKELREIEADPHDLAEWVDVIILAMDGFWRHGGKPEDLLPAMQAKQDKNFARTWPDWRTMGEDQAIEHDRSGETPQQSHSPTTETDPQMTVEEARDILDPYFKNYDGGAQEALEFSRWMAARADVNEEGRDRFLATASRIETALRALKASDAPSTTETE